MIQIMFNIYQEMMRMRMRMMVVKEEMMMILAVLVMMWIRVMRMVKMIMRMILVVLASDILMILEIPIFRRMLWIYLRIMVTMKHFDLVIIHWILVYLIKDDDDIIIIILLLYVYIKNYQHYFDGELLCMMILLSLDGCCEFTLE